MTDARFPDRWLSDKRIARLSDGHFRAFVTSLAWSVTNRTDGVIEPDDLALIPNFAKDAVKAFVRCGLWVSRAAGGWLIADFDATQTTSAQLKSLEVARAKEREKKARQRAAKRAASTDAVVPRDVPRDNTGKDRTGQDRTGREGDQQACAAGAEWPSWQGPGPSPYDEYK